MKSNRVFVSFAIEDVKLRDFLIGQKNNDKSPFEFIDMSVKSPWDYNWKEQCRTRIKGCDGMISIITPNTKNASGQLWEMKCAKDENVPVLCIYGYRDYKYSSTIPYEYGVYNIYDWNWDIVKNWLSRI